MALKGLDVVVSLKIAVWGGGQWTYAELARSLELSASETNASVKRSLGAGLLAEALEPKDKPLPVARALLEFMEHGLRYAFHAALGPVGRGVPTAHSAPPLVSRLAPDGEPPLVWPDPQGEARGATLRPLYRTVPSAARRDPALYELLALADALRVGRARERALAVELLKERLAGANAR